MMRHVRQSMVLAVMVGLPACGGAPTQPTPCSYTISPAMQAVASGGASVSATVTRIAGSCGWSASTAAAWITLSNASGSAGGTLAYSVAANAGGAREGTLTLAWSGGSATLTVTQEAAPTIDAGPPTIGPP